MVNICMVSDLSTGTQLALKIIELEYTEKDYQEFQLSIEGNDPTSIPISGTDLHESSLTIFDGLTPERVYKITGRTKCNDDWTDISGVAFITQIKPPNYMGTSKPVVRFMGGAM